MNHHSVLSAILISSMLIVFLSLLSTKVDQLAATATSSGSMPVSLTRTALSQSATTLTASNMTGSPNWFIVFLPLMFLKFCFLIDSLLLLVRYRLNYRLKSAKLVFIFLNIVLFLLFDVLLCLKLEHYVNIKLTYVLIPIWIVALNLLAYLYVKLSR